MIKLTKVNPKTMKLYAITLDMENVAQNNHGNDKVCTKFPENNKVYTKQPRNIHRYRT